MKWALLPQKSTTGFKIEGDGEKLRGVSTQTCFPSNPQCPNDTTRRAPERTVVRLIFWRFPLKCLLLEFGRAKSESRDLLHPPVGLNLATEPPAIHGTANAASSGRGVHSSELVHEGAAKICGDLLRRLSPKPENSLNHRNFR